MRALGSGVEEKVLVVSGPLEGVGAQCVTDHMVLVESLELVQVLRDCGRLAVGARPRDGIEDCGRGEEAGEDVESGLSSDRR